MKTLLLAGLLLWAGLAYADDTIKIGVILPLTGNSAHLGERFQKTIKLFEQDHPSAKYKIFIEDDGGNNRDTMLCAQRLVNLNHVDALVTWAAGAGNVVAPYAEEKHVLHLNISLDVKIVQNRHYTFLHWVNPYSEAQMCTALMQQRGARNVAIIGTRQQAIMLLARLTEEDCSKSGIKTNTLYFNPGERDFRTPLTEIKLQKPDYVVLMAFSPEMEILSRQIREVGIPAPITNMGTFDFSSDRTYIEGYPYVSAAAPSVEWNNRFEKLYGAKATFAEPYLYDILKIITDAYEKTGHTGNLKAAEWITQLKNYPSEVGLLTPQDGHILFSSASYYTTLHGQRTHISFEDIK